MEIPDSNTCHPLGSLTDGQLRWKVLWHVVLIDMKVLVKEDTKHNATYETMVSWVFQPMTHCLKGNMTCMSIWIPINACADAAESLLTETQPRKKHS